MSRTTSINIELKAAEAAASAKSLNKDIDAIGVSGNEAGRRATVAMNGLESSTRAAAAAMASALSGLKPLASGALAAGDSVSALAVSTEHLAQRKAGLLGQLQNVQSSMRSETKVLADAQAAVAQYGNEHEKLNRAVAESEAKLANYVRQQTVLKSELGSVSTALKTASTAQLQVNVAQSQSVESSNKSAVASFNLSRSKDLLAESTGILTTLLHTNTSAISTGGTVLSGYDAITQAFLRTFNGIPVIFAAGISIGLQLLTTFLSLGKAKESNSNITSELINNEKTLIEIFTKMGEAAGLSAGEIQKQTQAFEAMISRDIGGAIAGYATKYQKYAEDLAAATAAEQAHKEMVSILNQAESDRTVALLQIQRGTANTAEASAFLTKQLESANERIRWANGALPGLKSNWDDATDVLEKSNKEVRQSVDNLAEMARAAGMSSREILFMAQNARVSAEALEHLRVSLTAAAAAAWEWNRARQSFRLPGLDFGKTDEGQALTRERLNERIQGLEQLGKSERDILLSNSSAIERVIKETEAQVKADLSFKQNVITKNQILAETKSRLAATGDETSRYALAQLKMEAAVQRGSEQNRRAGGAARAYANELVNLTQKAEAAEAALAGDSFTARQKKLDSELKAMRARLEISERDRAATIDAINRYEAASTEKLRRDRAEAERRFDSELRDMRIRGIEDVFERERAEMNARFQDKAFALLKEYGLSIDTIGKIVAYRMAMEEAYDRWHADKMKRVYAELLKGVEKYHEAAYNIERKWLERSQDLLVHMLKRRHDRQFALMDEAERLRAQLSRRDGKTTNADVAFGEKLRLEKAITDLRKLGLEASDVDRIFGSASRSVEHFLDRVNALNSGPTAVLAQGLRDIAMEFLFSANAALRFGDMVEAAMAQAASGSTTFGQAIKAQVFGLIADMASAFGDFFIKWGVGQMLLNPAAGIAAIAAGIALKAFAGLMRGKAQGATQSNSTAAGGGGGSAASGGGTGAERGSPQAIIIDLSSRQIMDRHTEALNRHSQAMDAGLSARINDLDRRIAAYSRLEQSASPFRHIGTIGKERLEIERSGLLSASRTSRSNQRTEISFDTRGVAKIVLAALEEQGVLTVDTLNNNRGKSRSRQALTDFVVAKGKRHINK